MEPSSNENQTSSLQRILIGIGTLIVVILTVIAAIFLAMQQTPDDATPVVQVTPSPPTQIIPTTPPALPSFTPTSIPPSDTPTATLVPPVETTEIPPTPTDTPVPPPPPLFTDTPTIIVVTATPLPAATAPSQTDTCPPPPNWVAYTVQSGDTLNSLATKTNINIFDLQQANCLPSSTLQPGQIIYLPFTPPTPTDIPTATATSPSGPIPTRTPTAVAPVINNVVPDNVDEDTNQEQVIITIIGRNFRSRETGFEVELRGPQSLALQLGEARSDTSFDAIVPPNLLLGTYDIVVTNPNDRAGIRESAFTIGQAPTPTPGTPQPGPEIDAVNPIVGFNNDDVTITVEGNNFRPNDNPDFEVALLMGETIQVLSLVPGTGQADRFNAIVPMGLPPGLYDLRVKNSNIEGQTIIRAGAYRSREP